MSTSVEEQVTLVQEERKTSSLVKAPYSPLELETKEKNISNSTYESVTKEGENAAGKMVLKENGFTYYPGSEESNKVKVAWRHITNYEFSGKQLSVTKKHDKVFLFEMKRSVLKQVKKDFKKRLQREEAGLRGEESLQVLHQPSQSGKGANMAGDDSLQSSSEPAQMALISGRGGARVKPESVELPGMVKQRHSRHQKRRSGGAAKSRGSNNYNRAELARLEPAHLASLNESFTSHTVALDESLTNHNDEHEISENGTSIAENKSLKKAPEAAGEDVAEDVRTRSTERRADRKRRESRGDHPAESVAPNTSSSPRWAFINTHPPVNAPPLSFEGNENRSHPGDSSLEEQDEPLFHDGILAGASLVPDDPEAQVQLANRDGTNESFEDEQGRKSVVQAEAAKLTDFLGNRSLQLFIFGLVCCMAFVIIVAVVAVTLASSSAASPETNPTNTSPDPTAVPLPPSSTTTGLAITLAPTTINSTQGVPTRSPTTRADACGFRTVDATFRMEVAESRVSLSPNELIVGFFEAYAFVPQTYCSPVLVSVSLTDQFNRQLRHLQEATSGVGTFLEFLVTSEQSETDTFLEGASAKAMFSSAFSNITGTTVVGIVEVQPTSPDPTAVTLASSFPSALPSSEPSSLPSGVPTSGPTTTNCAPITTDLEDIPTRRLQEGSYHFVGCFERQTSTDSHLLEGVTLAERAEECSQHCVTYLYGVAGNSCMCFVETPGNRLSLGSCATLVPNCYVPKEDQMETYFHVSQDFECNQEATESVRNFLVEEDDAPFGFDIVENTYKSSPFELYKQECGTNVYEVQTEVSEGSKQLKTSIQEVSQFALERRKHLSESIKSSASAGGSAWGVTAAISVSASHDKEQNSIFKSTGADSKGSKVFTSLGVKRLAEVTLIDFDNKMNFVTFTPQFGSLLRSYRDEGYKKTVAYEIINTYGQFIVTRGIFGGYFQIRSTSSKLDAERGFETEEDSRKCFETSVSGQASGYGFSASFEVDRGKCTEEAEKEFQNQQSRYATEANEQSAVGGLLDTDNGFLVIPATATLLTSRDKYPQGDDGIELRVLSDFLKPSKVSPLEVRRLQILEEQLGQIHSHLEGHIFEYLEEKAAVLEECSDCVVPYMDIVDGMLQCQCYNPNIVHTEQPSTSPTVSPTAGPGYLKCGKSHSSIVNDAKTATDMGKHRADNSWKWALSCLCCGTWHKRKTYEGIQGRWFRGVATDHHDCSGLMHHKIVLEVPALSNWNLYTYLDNPNNLYQTKRSSASHKTMEIWVKKEDKKHGSRSPDFTYFVKVEYQSGEDCKPWKLTMSSM